MASQENGNKRGKFVTISGLWKSGKIYLGNNIRKQVAKTRGKEITEEIMENSLKFRIHANSRIDKSDLFRNKNDADAHLMVEYEHIDELIEYLQDKKKEHYEFWKDNKEWCHAGQKK